MLHTKTRQPDGENVIRSTFSSSSAGMAATGVPLLTTGLNVDIYSDSITLVHQTSFLTSSYVVTCYHNAVIGHFT